MSLYKHFPRPPKDMSDAVWQKKKGLAGKIKMKKTGIRAAIKACEKSFEAVGKVAPYYAESYVDTSTIPRCKIAVKEAKANLAVLQKHKKSVEALEKLAMTKAKEFQGNAATKKVGVWLNGLARQLSGHRLKLDDHVRDVFTDIQAEIKERLKEQGKADVARPDAEKIQKKALQAYKKKVTLPLLLKNKWPALTKSFHDYAKKGYFVDDLDFLTSKSSNQDLYETFLKVGAKREINISGKLRKPLIQKGAKQDWKGMAADMKAAKQAVLFTLHSDSLKLWLESKEFKAAALGL